MPGHRLDSGIPALTQGLIIEMTRKLSPADSVVRNPEVLFAEIDGEILALSVDLGRFFALEGPGGRIWNLLERPISTSAVVQKLVEEFDVEPRTCEAETTAFIERLVHSGLARAEA